MISTLLTPLKQINNHPLALPRPLPPKKMFFLKPSPFSLKKTKAYDDEIEGTKGLLVICTTKILNKNHFWKNDSIHSEIYKYWCHNNTY